MKIEIEIGATDAMTAEATRVHLQKLMDRLKPKGVAKLMAMYAGIKKIAVEGFFISNGI